MSIENKGRNEFIAPTPGTRASGATGQVKKATFFGRKVTVDWTFSGGLNKVTYNRGSLIDFLNAQGAGLKKGGYFWGGSSYDEILSKYNEIKKMPPEVLKSNVLKNQSTFSKEDIAWLMANAHKLGFQSKSLCEHFLAVQYPKFQVHQLSPDVLTETMNKSLMMLGQMFHGLSSTDIANMIVKRSASTTNELSYTIRGGQFHWSRHTQSSP